jgi:hypothetical protein
LIVALRCIAILSGIAALILIIVAVLAVVSGAPMASEWPLFGAIPTAILLCQKAAAPFAHGHGMHVEQAGNRLVLQAVGASQHDPRALGHGLRGLRPGGHRRQFRFLRRCQRQNVQPSSSHPGSPASTQKSSQVPSNRS